MLKCRMVTFNSRVYHFNTVCTFDLLTHTVLVKVVLAMTCNSGSHCVNVFSPNMHAAATKKWHHTEMAKME